MPQPPNLLVNKSNPGQPWRKRLRTGWNKNGWLLLLLLAVAVCLLSLWGLSVPATPEYGAATWLDRIYQTLQLFPLNSALAPGDKPWQLEIARLLAPLLTVVAATKALMLFFHEKVQMLRLGRWRGHIVICGLGEKGRQLADDMLQAGSKVVIIEVDGANEKIFSCREQGAIVLVGSASRKSRLLKARAQHARQVFVVCGNDSLNLEIALLAHGLMLQADAASPGSSSCPIYGSASPVAAPPERASEDAVSQHVCFVHLVDTDLRDLLAQRKLLARINGQVAIRSFNIYENAAQQLFNESPPDAAARSLDQASVHLLLIGFGQMGQSIVLQAASIGHYANDGHIRISVIDKMAEKKGELFLQSHPTLQNICTITFHSFDIDETEFLSGTVLDGLPGGRGSVTQAVICLEQDATALACALRLQRILQATPRPLLVRVNVESALLCLLQRQESGGSRPKTPYKAQVQSFGSIGDCCSCAVVLADEQDRMARRIHDCYLQIRLNRGDDPAGDPSMQSWIELDPDLQHSSRSQAAHLDVKLRSVGCRRQVRAATAPSPLFVFSRAEVEQLAAMEHARWLAERVLAGWTWGPEKDIERRISPYLVAWDGLAESIRDFNRSFVRDIPEIVRLIGEEIVREETASR